MRRQRHALASTLALSYSLALLGDQMLYVFLPSHPGAAGIHAASLGIVLSANRFVRLAANSLAGFLSDRFGRRRPYLLGMVLALGSTGGYLASEHLWSLLAWRAVWGIAFALISVGGVAIMLDLSTDEDRGRTVGTYQSLLQLGTLLGLVLSGVLTDLVGYRGTLAIYTPLAALGLLVAALALRAPGGARDGRSQSGRPDGLAPRGAPAGPGSLATLRGLDRRLVAPAYVNFVSLFTGSGVLMATLGVYLKELEAVAGGWLVPVATLTGMLLAARRLAGMVEAPIAGHLLDRLGDRRIVAAPGVTVSLAGFIVLAIGRDVGTVVAGVILVAVGEGLLHPAVVVWTGDGAPLQVRGMVMGGLATAGDLGAALGPLVGYALLETGGIRAAYALCAALIVSALLVLAVVRPAPRRTSVRE